MHFVYETQNNVKILDFVHVQLLLSLLCISIETVVYFVQRYLMILYCNRNT